ncbi:alpha-xenorhabdolysin family binary toxin subunit A [Pseudomonas sp. DSP3-2-2]|uniref:alpha-xenorhabdolysin family binary toxin subunit A n=1 Tax=unclassified Pseudomonas TaxID=196821 RepID=UPI003CF4B752
MLTPDEFTVERLNEISTHYINTRARRETSAGRAPGLLVTDTDVRAIKRYVASALELPCELAQVKTFLGYEVAGVAGLEPTEMQSLHQSVKRHAHGWPDIESGMKTVGSDLVVFSDALKSSGQTLITFIEGLEGFQSAIGVVGDVDAVDIANYPRMDLTARDKSRAPTLLALVEDMRIVIRDCSRTTTQVSTGISSFKTELKTRIAPAVGLTLTLMQRHRKDSALIELNLELDDLNRQIQQQADSFEDFLERQWSLLLFAGSLFIPGAEASPQTQLEALLARKREVQNEIRHNHALIAALLSLQTDVQDLGVRMSAAASGASNLESLWIQVLAYVDGSARRLSHMDDAVYLVVFVARLRAMIQCWIEIRKHSQDLLSAFDNAVAEVEQ